MSYTPPSVAGFFPEGTTAAVRRAFFNECMKKERDFKYNKSEQDKRFKMRSQITAVISQTLFNYNNLDGLTGDEVFSLICPNMGWQSCHMEMLLNLENGILNIRLEHLNNWAATSEELQARRNDVLASKLTGEAAKLAEQTAIYNQGIVMGALGQMASMMVATTG